MCLAWASSLAFNLSTHRALDCKALHGTGFRPCALHNDEGWPVRGTPARSRLAARERAQIRKKIKKRLVAWGYLKKMNGDNSLHVFCLWTVRVLSPPYYGFYPPGARILSPRPRVLSPLLFGFHPPLSSDADAQLCCLGTQVLLLSFCWGAADAYQSGTADLPCECLGNLVAGVLQRS